MVRKRYLYALPHVCHDYGRSSVTARGVAHAVGSRDVRLVSRTAHPDPRRSVLILSVCVLRITHPLHDHIHALHFREELVNLFCALEPTTP